MQYIHNKNNRYILQILHTIINDDDDVDPDYDDDADYDDG